MEKSLVDGIYTNLMEMRSDAKFLRNSELQENKPNLVMGTIQIFELESLFPRGTKAIMGSLSPSLIATISRKPEIAPNAMASNYSMALI